MNGQRPPSETTVQRRSVLHALRVGLLALGGSLALATGAMAAGTPVKVATPIASGPPSVAVHLGTAAIAWANTQDLNGALNFVQYCVLPDGATACTHSGSLIPADGAQFIDNVTVLYEGSMITITADVFGAAGNNAGDYEPVQEWQSTDGGATFTIVNGGLSVTDGVLNADTQPVNALNVPDNGVLGFGWVTAGGPPTFNVAPLLAPPECSTKTCPAGFATLEPPTNPDQLTNEPGHFAGQSGAIPGVMGVFDSLFTNGPLGCAQSFGTAFVYGAGNQSAGNSYNISPGSAGSAWRTPVTQLDCNTEYSTVAGGPSGFGVLQDDLGSSTTVYRRFDQSTGAFDTPPVTVAPHGELDAALAQDGSGDVYATYLLGGDGGPIALSYSADGGKSFASGTINPDHDTGAHDVTSAVGDQAPGWAAWLDNGSVYAQSFVPQDAISPATVSGGASSNGTTVTLDVTCATYPCTISITLTAPETVIVHAAAVAHRTRRRTRTVTLGRGHFTITKAGTPRLTVRLSGAGRSFVRSHSGHLTINSVIKETLEHQTVISKPRLRLTVSRRRHR
jgi:hypothetical protein